MTALARPTGVRVELLHDAHRAALATLVDADPIANVVIASRLHETRSLDPRVLGGPLLGAFDGAGTLVAAVFAGGNLVPIGGSSGHWQALAEALLPGMRSCGSFVGRAAAVRGFWRVLEASWGPCRAIRDVQPVMVLDRAGAPPAGDGRVRPIQAEELDAYLPAAAAMFTEELDVAPERLGGGPAYRRRVAATIDSGRALGIVDTDGSVLFKADIGAVSARACQLQGVWVRPDHRGTGLGTAAFASVLRHALTLAPAACLYVNDYNVAARRMYARLGMRQVATFSTILF